MVDVVKSNYEEKIPEIIKLIKKASFVAIDAEYTGLFSTETPNSLFDSAPRRYEKLLEGVRTFQICQVGIAIFEKTWDKNEFMVDCFNIYAFPVTFDKFSKRESIRMQVSSLNFLSQNNFDFNKYIKEGVPFCNKEKEKSLREFIQNYPSFLRSAEHIDKLYFPSENGDLSPASIEKIVERLKGLTKVIQAISDEKKPVVGHNLLNDLVLIYEQFVEESPETYEKFKVAIHNLFNSIYDTKYLAIALRKEGNFNKEQSEQLDLLRTTTLFSLYQNVHVCRGFLTNIDVKPRDENLKYALDLIRGRKNNLDHCPNTNSHEAGFDAYVTGTVFLRLASLSLNQGKPILRYHMSPPTSAELLSSVSKWENLVYIGRANLPYLNLAGPDPITWRPDVIQIKSCKENNAIVNVYELERQLIPFGDIDLVSVDDDTVNLACGNWSIAKKIWVFLREEGYEVLVASDSSLPKFARRSFVFGGATLITAMILFYCFRKS